MNFSKCNKCQFWHWDDAECQPQFKVWVADEAGFDYDNPHRSKGDSHEDAADHFACWYNAMNDYSLNDSSIDIELENEQGERKRFRISAEPTINYSSEELQMDNVPC